MAPKIINILFTSVGRRVELIKAFRNAFQNLGLEGQLVATDIDPLAPAIQVVDKFYLVPRFSDPQYIPSLVKICEQEAIHIVFPLIDPEIPILAQHHETFKPTGAQLAVLGKQQIDIANDKWLTFKFFKDLGINTPNSWLPEDLDFASATYPLFIKPRFGSAGKHTFRVNNAKELEFFSTYVPDPIIQDYLPGSEITNDIICDMQGELLGISSRKRLEVRSGEVSKGVTVHDSGIIRDCSKISSALNTVGPITVQCILKEDTPYFIEINPRFGGGVPLGIAAGVNSPTWFLSRCAQLPVTIPPLGSYQTGIYLTRFDESFFLTTETYEQIASHRF